MKATGIVRRVDDLGHIVIPKEIRRTLKYIPQNIAEEKTQNFSIFLLEKPFYAGFGKKIENLRPKFENAQKMVYNQHDYMTKDESYDHSNYRGLPYRQDAAGAENDGAV